MKKQSKRRSAPKKVRAIQTSRHLRVSHRRHTGHVTPHRTTSYPVLAMIVLIVGVLMASWTTAVKAVDLTPPITDSYTVHTKVVGTAPTQPPTISYPQANTKFMATPITVSGRCQVETYLKLFRNGVFSGVAICKANGTYTFQTDLFNGANKLQVRIYSPTDQAGPYSLITTVYYQPIGNSGSATDNANPLLLKSQYNYRGYYTGTVTDWQLSVEGGTPPYALAVDWGDGTHDLVSKATAGNFTLQHKYKRAGGYKGSYVVQFSASDTNKAQTFLQLLAIINNPGGANNVVSNVGGGSGSVGDNLLNQGVKYAWSGYGVAVLMLVSFWLGERRELQQLKPRLRKQKHA
jgi:hypothetical protein